MQIYGILLNIRGILLKNRENQRNSFLNLLPDDPFSRSFSVVFGCFYGHSWRKSENFGEKWRISEKSFRFHSFSFHFIPFYSSNPRFSSPNVKSYWI